MLIAGYTTGRKIHFIAKFASSQDRSCSEVRWVVMSSLSAPSSLTTVCVSLPLGLGETCRCGGNLPVLLLGELSEQALGSPPGAFSMWVLGRRQEESLHALNVMQSHFSFCAVTEGLNCGTGAPGGEA